MTDQDQRLRDALQRIAELANSANFEATDATDHASDSRDGALCCIPKSLPRRLLQKAAETAVRLNPVNAPSRANFAAMGLDAGVIGPQYIAVLTSKYWGPTQRRLSVSFMETTPSDLKARIIQHMNAWTRTGCISFAETNGLGDIRISRGAGGYYSYLGSDVLHIPRNRQTMNLQNFTMSTPESEYKRVVRHETGHTLGAPHEHMRRALVDRIDRQKAYDYFWRTQRWPPAMVDQQVLTPLDELSIMSTPADQTSIMCYQLPGSITTDGNAILGGLDINATDYAFIGNIYPRPGHTLNTDPGEDDWPESDDPLIEY
jgi:Astacin (Peptidase family M12A)